MSDPSLGAIFVNASLVNNFVLAYFLGICPFLGVSRRLDTAVGMGLAVTFVMAASALVTYLIRRYALLPLNLDFLQYVVFIFVIAGMVQLVEMYLRKFFHGLYVAFGIYLPLITTNCAVLGVCILIWMKNQATVAGSLVYSVFGGLGFTLAIVIMAGIREELEFADIPAPLRGIPITLLTAAILGLAFMGFAGIGS